MIDTLARDAMQVEERMEHLAVTVLGQKSVEEAAAGAEDHFVTADLGVLGDQSHVTELVVVTKCLQ